MARRKNIRDRWECSWDCGFKHFDIGEVSWHETDDHCNEKPSAYDHTGKKFRLTWHCF